MNTHGETHFYQAIRIRDYGILVKATINRH